MNMKYLGGYARKELMNKLYRGIFWIKDINNLENNSNYLIKIETNLSGNPISYPYAFNSKKGYNYTHKGIWKQLDRKYTNGKPYDYYPRGRVEIRDNKLWIYMNRNLYRDDVIDYIKKEYGLNNQKFVNQKIEIDFHGHYKCHLDKGY